MATALMPFDPAAADAHTMRILPITADLMPPEVLAARRARRARRTVLSALAAFALVLGGWYAVATLQTAATRVDLANVTAEAEGIRRQQQQYREVTSLQNQSKAITGQLTTLLGNDLQWSELFTSLRTTGDKNGVRLNGINGQLAQDASGGTPTVPSAVKDKTIGTVTITGSGASKRAVADYVTALATVSGTANAQIGTVTQLGETVDFTVKLDVTAAALGGRYAPAKPGK